MSTTSARYPPVGRRPIATTNTISRSKSTSGGNATCLSSAECSAQSLRNAASSRTTSRRSFTNPLLTPRESVRHVSL